MSENIKYVHMQHSGPIPDLIGWFNGGQTVTLDLDTMTVVDQAPLAQRAYDASPLVEPAQEEAPTQPEPVASEPVPEAQPEQAPEPPIEAQVVDVTPAQEVGEV
jgi:hypothetical protein